MRFEVYSIFVLCSDGDQDGRQLISLLVEFFGL